MTRNAFLVLFPLKVFLIFFFFSQYLLVIKIHLKISLTILHGFFLCEESSSFAFLNIFNIFSVQRKQACSYHYSQEALRGGRVNTKWMDSFAEEHSKLLIASGGYSGKGGPWHLQLVMAIPELVSSTVQSLIMHQSSLGQFAHVNSCYRNGRHMDGALP